MLKAVLMGVTALSIAGGGLAAAQQARGTDANRWRPSVEDRAAFTDARIAGLKAGLKLTADQEKNWAPVETAIRDLAKQRADRMAATAEARRNKERPDAIGRLRSSADAMTTRAAGLKRLADAAEPLYKSLDEGQKHRFSMLMRMGARGAQMGPRSREGRAGRG